MAGAKPTRSIDGAEPTRSFAGTTQSAPWPQLINPLRGRTFPRPALVVRLTFVYLLFMICPWLVQVLFLGTRTGIQPRVSDDHEAQFFRE